MIGLIRGLAGLLLLIITIELWVIRAAGPSTAAWVVFQRYVDGNWEIHRMGLNGVGVYRLTYSSANDWNPSWVDGNRAITFLSFREYSQRYYTFDYAGRNLSYAEGFPAAQRTVLVSPDGQWLLFAIQHQGNTDLYRREVNGTALERLTDAPDNDWGPVWSPNGQQIVFTSQRDGNAEIYVMQADGSQQRRLTDHHALDWNPVWSSDGQWIVFISNRAGNDELYRIRPDGSGLRRLTRYPLSDHDPAVSTPIERRWGQAWLMVGGVVLLVGLGRVKGLFKSLLRRLIAKVN